MQPLLFFKKITAGFRISLNRDADDAYKLLILQVFSGLKRATTIDGISKKHRLLIKRILLLLGYLKIYYKLIDMDKNIKIIFSKEREVVLGLYNLHDKVFRRNESHDKYGELLGYPRCCIAQFASPRPEQLIAYSSCDVEKVPTNVKWDIDYRLNRLSMFSLIYHIPCKLSCKETLGFAKKILNLYNTYNSYLTQKVIFNLKNPVLIFTQNNYIRFKGKIENNTISYSCIEHVNPHILETGLVKPEDIKISKLVNLIKAGNKIVFNERNFDVFHNDKLLVIEKESETPLCQIIDFK